MLRALVCSVTLLVLIPAGSGQAQDKGDEKGLNITGELNAKDGFDKVKKDCYCKTYKFKMMAGKTYQIDMKSMELDAYLRLEDSSGKQVAFDDDSGGNLDARIVFQAAKDDTYVIIATTFAGNATGKFTLTAVQK
jgi:hypothetical protein